ncbi:MAG: beta-propeller domain-containing protein [bacterium]|nr:beta-propeller domain-containing protein [bacterium]
MMNNKKYIFGVGVFLFIFTAVFLGVLPVEAETKVYQNPVPKKDWVKYGVNPWAYDTDNDGFGDDWEILHGYCPTNYLQGVTLNDEVCNKGKINFKKITYTAPANLQENLPRVINKFNSCVDLNSFLKKQGDGVKKHYSFYDDLKMGALTTNDAGSWGLKATVSAPTGDFSSTNIQVAGVDELDLVKTDGKYIYSIAIGTKKELVITKAVPVDKAMVVSRVALSYKDNPTGIFLNGDYLMVLNDTYYYSDFDGRRYNTVAQIYSIKDRVHPRLLRSLGFEASLIGTRMIDGYAYLVLRDSGYNAMDYSGNVVGKNVIPKYFDLNTKLDSSKKMNSKDLVGCSQISYLSPAESPQYLAVVSFPVSNSNKIEKQVLMGGGDQIYVSEKNLYVASTRNSRWDWWKKEMTDIQKFSLEKGKIKLVATTAVPGTILNQFSMDEYKGKLRVVVTEGRTGGWESQGRVQRNGLYILNENLVRVGWYENFGEGEKIYSARFMGERAYVVTFLQTDPLFVFDLKNVREPKLLGELVIPGFSTYLHPYDTNHLIGVGLQSAINTSTPGFTWNQGLKIGLFDVTDPTAPKQLFSEEIGDRGSNSPALADHHAFLFSRSKKLLAFPVSIAQLTAEQKKMQTLGANGQLTYEGLFAYDVSLQNGFQFLGGVSRGDVITQVSNAIAESLSTGVGYNEVISRSLYIGDYLYVFSRKILTIHKIGKDMNEVKKVMLVDN